MGCPRYKNDMVQKNQTAITPVLIPVLHFLPDAVVYQPRPRYTITSSDLGNLKFCPTRKYFASVDPPIILDQT